MQNQLQIFQHEKFGEVRVLEIGGAPWFVGKDVADALGYGNYRQALKTNVDDDDRGVHSMDTPGGAQKLTIINESGLYSLVLSSRLPTAKLFKRWVTSEVLPSIRKHGAFIMDEILNEAEKNQEFAFELFRKLQAEKGKTAVLLDTVERLSPKARYYDLVLQSKGVVQISVIAKDYGMSAVAFNRLLHDMKIQYRIGGTWVLYQRYADKGYTKSRTYYTASGGCVIHTYWTQKGRLFLYDALVAAGILPLMEIEDAAEFAFGEAFQ